MVTLRDSHGQAIRDPSVESDVAGMRSGTLIEPRQETKYRCDDFRIGELVWVGRYYEEHKEILCMK
jgi:hypothetical protein